MTEAELVLYARNGDGSAFEQLVSPHEQAVWRVCCHMLRNTEDAADAFQQAMLRAWKSLPDFRGNASFGTWIYRIAVSVCLDIIRSKKARPSVSLDAMHEGEGFDPPSSSPQPDEALEKKERREEVRRALASLSEEQRIPLVLFAVEQHPYEEIAEMLSLPIGTVKSRIARARIQLAKLLSENGNNSFAATSKRSERRAER